MWHLTRATATGARECNEDRHLFAEHENREARRLTAVVCDGLGGYEDGEVAAETAAKAFTETASGLRGISGPGAGNTRLNQALECARAAVEDRCGGHVRERGMATTLTGIEIGNNEIRWVSVGDSPLMLHRAGAKAVQLLNRPHNPPGRPHKLISVINGDPIALVDRGTDGLRLHQGDTVIVASDGIHTLKRKEIAQVLVDAEGTEAMIAQLLVQKVLDNDREHQDNVTVVAIRIS